MRTTHLLILAGVAIGAGSGDHALGQSLDHRSAWYQWSAGGWGGAAWGDGPFIHGPPFIYGPPFLYGPGAPGAWPYPGYWPYPGHWYWYSPCYPFVSCAEYSRQRLWERRQERAAALRSEAADAGYRAAGAAGQHFPLPATELAPESELQPEYRDTGKIRPAFEHSGTYLPQLLERRGAPNEAPGKIEDRSR